MVFVEEPEDFVFDQLVLDGAVEDFVAVTHVHIDHVVSGIGPDHGDVGIA